MELAVLNLSGKGKKGKVEVSSRSFDTHYNGDLVHQAVTAYMAGSRQGTKAQKNRSAVSGGGRKPFRQKGTVEPEREQLEGQSGVVGVSHLPLNQEIT